jgi:hypothetical protein
MGINHDKRKQWLHDVRQFKMGVKVRAKLGALDLYCAEVTAMRRGSNRFGDRPAWDSPSNEWLQYLCECIQKGSFPPKLLRGFAQTAEFTLYTTRPLEPQGVIDAMNYVFKKHSRTLRNLYGVFDGHSND